MIVDHSSGGEPLIDSPSSTLERIGAKLRPKLDAHLLRLQKTPNQVLHSTAILPGSAARRIQRSNADVVNLHWVSMGYISVGQLARIKPPTVWTLHDMWPFSGAEHYSDADPTARWRHGYHRQNRPADHVGVDLDAWVWRRKARHWQHRHRVIAPSRWMAECARSSALLATWPTTVIPNPVPVDVFRPYDQLTARSVLGLPAAAPVILFGAIGGHMDRRKGFDLLLEALGRVAQYLPEAIGVVFGAAEPADAPRLPLPIRWMGALHDDEKLALVYSAADVMVVPSRQDNLPQTGTEAQSCGTPVVAFGTSGLADVVGDRETGYLARPFDPQDLAAGIHWVLEDRNRSQKLSKQARSRATRNWAPAIVAEQYLDVYREAIEQESANSTIERP